MSYKTLTNMYNDFNGAVEQTTGLNEFYMINESEINKHKNYQYPICVVEIPNSSISNINRAYEEYEISCFILDTSSRNESDYTELSNYDTCMDCFNGWVSEVMKQRGGIYVVDKESFNIERVANFGNDLVMGVKVEFTLLAPSSLGFYTEDFSVPVWNITTGLYALFNGNKNVIRTSSSLSWVSEHPKLDPKTITHYDSDNVPTYSDSQFTFAPPVTNPTEGFEMSNITFSTSGWSVFFKMSVASDAQGDVQTIFRITDPSSGDGFIFGLTTNGSNPTLDGQPFYQIDDDDDSGSVDDVNSAAAIYETSADLEPLADTVVGLINDTANDKLILYIDSGDSQVSYEEVGSHSTQFTGAKLLIGTSELSSWDFGYRGFVGTISHVAIYDSIISPTDAATIANDLTLL